MSPFDPLNNMAGATYRVLNDTGIPEPFRIYALVLEWQSRAKSYRMIGDVINAESYDRAAQQLEAALRIVWPGWSMD
ncbi:MAG: hypothetical protein GYB68_08495 [Chloroflexi bacterium]|nr:hypothetical protein [Chloroflexota bacterium]